MAEAFRDASDEFECLAMQVAGFDGLSEQHDVDLLGDDDDADGSEHAMNGSDGEEFGQFAELEDAKKNLDDASDDAHGQHASVADHAGLFGAHASGDFRSECGDCSKDGCNHAGGGAFDGQFRVA